VVLAVRAFQPSGLPRRLDSRLTHHKKHSLRELKVSCGLKFQRLVPRSNGPTDPKTRLSKPSFRAMVAPRFGGAVTLKTFACSRALAFYRSSIGWSKLGLSVGGRSGDAVWLRRLLPRSEPLGAQPSLHLYHDAPRSEQTRSRPSTASIEAPLHSASATQIGPLETTTQTRGLTFASPMGRSHATYH
jgi:hypothetical protein